MRKTRRLRALGRVLTGLALAGLVGSACSPSGPSGEPPERGGSIQASATFGLAGWTEFTFTAQGVTDPDGDPITYLWDFGDGTPAPASAATVVKRFDATGVRTVTLRVRDNDHSPVDAGQTSVTIRSLTGTWAGLLTRSPIPVSVYAVDLVLALTQNGQSLSGSCSAVFPGSPVVSFPFQDIRFEGLPSAPIVRISSHCPNTIVTYDLEFFPDTDVLGVLAFGDGTAGSLKRQ